MRRFATFSLLLVTYTIYGQSTYKGIVVDSATLMSLSYVNIGIVGKNIGTVTDTRGNFQIELDSPYEEDTLRFSMVGYKSQSFRIEDFKREMSGNSMIKLVKKITLLEEIVVTNKRFRERVLGNKTKSKSMAGGFTSNELGNEVGIVIKVHKSPTYIERFSASIVSNKYDSLKFRLNFYSLLDGLPHDHLIDENIIITSHIREGLLDVDLGEYNIVVNDDFFVSLEWIENLGEDKNGLLFSLGLLGSPIISRHTSQGIWEKIGGVGIGFNVTVKH